MEATFGSKGALGVRHISGTVSAPLTWKLRNWLRWGFVKGFIGYCLGLLVSRVFNVAVMLPRLRIVKIFADGRRMDFGVVGYRSVTTAFVVYMTDQLQTETSTWGDFKYHDSGVGTTAENVADTDMETTDGESRATGSQTEGASTNIYKSVGTITYTSTKAITEHGLFNAATSVTLMDRTKFTAVNVVSGDSIQFTYELTCTAGG